MDSESATDQALGVEGKAVRVAFGLRLRSVREAADLSQEALAAKAGLDRSYVGSVERGERNISLENICVLAKALSVEPKELFSQWTHAK